ncbi:MAG: hypothetical protein ACJASC_001552 [Limimaricola cinnabarinus]|jgi:hypothetical protein|uniref:DUF2852 domain-containing protein n=1 Tax=Limimaricola cinnabarinus LL-001 TaxID=1337093 RepID=U3AQA2_9RHOB|nr:hypothetical protein MBELCI_2960 [Limimaricola cinnabarinus LL-001]
MSTTDMSLSHRFERSGIKEWFGRAEAWLDARGRPAWIAAMVLGFIFVWPLGLAILAYMIWSKRMFSKSCRNRSARVSPFATMRSSGNTAFDAYKTETLRRLEDEQRAFESFLERLREAKDKAEFDQFMDDRAAKARATGATDDDNGSDGANGDKDAA